MTAGQLPSGEQSEVLANLVVPEVFAVHELAVDREIDGVVRLEWWGYPDLGRMVVFIDGVRAAEGPLPMPGAGWPQSPDRTVDPTLLQHELSAEERSDLLGPPADRLPASRTQGVAPPGRGPGAALPPGARHSWWRAQVRITNTSDREVYLHYPRCSSDSDECQLMPGAWWFVLDPGGTHVAESQAAAWPDQPERDTWSHVVTGLIVAGDGEVCSPLLELSPGALERHPAFIPVENPLPLGPGAG